VGYVGDGGPATAASLAFPQYAIFDAHDNRLISDGHNCRIRSVDKNGNISTIAGTGICGFSGDGRKALKAEINFPEGLGLAGAGNIFFADEGNSRVRKIDRSGRIATVAGNGTFQYCGDGGQALSACLNNPTALAVVGSPPQICHARNDGGVTLVNLCEPTTRISSERAQWRSLPT
jgi:hypothetical protein